MPLGTAVDLGPGHIVLDEAAPGKGHSSPAPLFDPYLLWPNGRPSSASAELLLYNRKINMNFEEKVKTTYKELTENFNASSKNLKSELKK